MSKVSLTVPAGPDAMATRRVNVGHEVTVWNSMQNHAAVRRGNAAQPVARPAVLSQRLGGYVKRVNPAFGRGMRRGDPEETAADLRAGTTGGGTSTP
jgi:hypothetical protein